MTRILKVKSVEGCMVQDYAAMRSGLKRFVGWKHVAKEIDGVVRSVFEKTDEVCTVPYRKEYFDAIREGSLEAADQATAQMVGLPPSKE
jgi:hypothetical protein